MRSLLACVPGTSDFDPGWGAYEVLPRAANSKVVIVPPHLLEVLHSKSEGAL